MCYMCLFIGNFLFLGIGGYENRLEIIWMKKGKLVSILCFVLCFLKGIIIIWHFVFGFDIDHGHGCQDNRCTNLAIIFVDSVIE